MTAIWRKRDEGRNYFHLLTSSLCKLFSQSQMRKWVRLKKWRNNKKKCRHFFLLLCRRCWIDKVTRKKKKKERKCVTLGWLREKQQSLVLTNRRTTCWCLWRRVIRRRKVHFGNNCLLCLTAKQKTQQFDLLGLDVENVRRWRISATLLRWGTIVCG